MIDLLSHRQSDTSRCEFASCVELCASYTVRTVLYVLYSTQQCTTEYAPLPIKKRTIPVPRYILLLVRSSYNLYSSIEYLQYCTAVYYCTLLCILYRYTVYYYTRVLQYILYYCTLLHML